MKHLRGYQEAGGGGDAAIGIGFMSLFPRDSELLTDEAKASTSTSTSTSMEM